MPPAKRILVLLGHPARERQSFCEALALAYKGSAERAGHEVRYLKLADLTFDPLLHEGYEGNQPLEPDIAAAQDAIRWAEHLVIVYPLWQFMIPALLKGFSERTFTQGFAYTLKAKNPLRAGLLAGKSARVVQTMGMPAFAYRLFFLAHGAKALKSMLSFCGIAPVRFTYFGGIECAKKREAYLKCAEALGAEGA